MPVFGDPFCGTLGNVLQETPEPPTPTLSSQRPLFTSPPRTHYMSTQSMTLESFSEVIQPLPLCDQLNNAAHWVDELPASQ